MFIFCEKLHEALVILKASFSNRKTFHLAEKFVVKVAQGENFHLSFNSVESRCHRKKTQEKYH